MKACAAQLKLFHGSAARQAAAERHEALDKDDGRIFLFLVSRSDLRLSAQLSHGENFGNGTNRHGGGTNLHGAAYFGRSPSGRLLALARQITGLRTHGDSAGPRRRTNRAERRFAD